MRLRAALLGAGLAVLAIGALGTPAQAANWKWIADYNSKSRCVDAGTQYVREGFSAYKCPWIGASGHYSLWVK
ncbi:hypothetical protein [Nonomuraea sp. NPDC049480]|uniref:hypothetical protein n=1 Tax=Nonomuraea sp. NPDC049480 TaxID=3364353 RepID=UPI00378E938E